MDALFSSAEQEKIREAVARAEKRTSGEIVPYVVQRSDRYDAAVWRGASIFALLALAASVFIFQFYHGWSLAWLYSGGGTAFLALMAGTLGAVLAMVIPPFKRFLAGERRMVEMVHLRAMEAFVLEEVFSTRERTGILIFISLFEHRIEVLGDAGINKQVAEEEWADVVARIRKGIVEDKLAEGLEDALGMCGGLLDRCGIELRADDTNELPDDIRIRKHP